MAQSPEPIVLDEIIIRPLVVSTMENNVYLITDRDDRPLLLIDAADNAPAIEQMLDQCANASDGYTPLIVTTHRHWDHHRALPEIAEATGWTIAASPEDAPELPVPVDRILNHGEIIECGPVSFEVIALRGHTPGSIALAYTESEYSRAPGRVHLFTGDSLFPGGPGKTNSREDFESLMNDLEERIFNRFDDRTTILPGHGMSSTLGLERPYLADWRSRGW